jgi:hypothetical protein
MHCVMPVNLTIVALPQQPFSTNWAVTLMSWSGSTDVLAAGVAHHSVTTHREESVGDQPRCGAEGL